jgi:N-acetylglucosaminyldiphosphoundecaprenol N-acetyl-beta-D-mannosaminyltransferase
MSNSPSLIPRRSIGDLWVNAIDRTMFLQVLMSEGALGKEVVFANHNMHSLYLIDSSQGMRAFYDLSRFIHVDGIPLVPIFNLIGSGPCSVQFRHRHTSPDWIFEFFRLASEKKMSVLIVGGKANVLSHFLALVRDRVKGIDVYGFDGYSCSEASRLQEIERFIARNRPNFILLGMGMPLQEEWYVRNRARFSLCSVVMNLGAFMDYWTGEKKMPPRWLARLGFEWLYRLASEPRRLAKRYLWEPYPVLFMLLKKRFFSG